MFMLSHHAEKNTFHDARLSGSYQFSDGRKTGDGVFRPSEKQMDLKHYNKLHGEAELEVLQKRICSFRIFILRFPELFMKDIRVVFAVFFLCFHLCGAETFIWIEGEEASAHSEDLSTDHPFVSRHPALSGGVSLGGQGTAGETFAEFETEIPRDGTYRLYVRKFWHHGPFRWRFGEEDAWQTVDRVALLDSVGLDRMHMVINWVFAGEAELSEGPVTLRMEQIRDGAFVLDALVITDEPFYPRGNLNPGERSGNAVEGFFAWEPDPDPLDGTSPIDLRHLNETYAGVNGPMRREGDRFVLGDGTPVRFWIVQADLRDMSIDQIDRWARRLAKYGVNMVRMNLGVFFDYRARGNEAGFARELARLHYVVAALKREGIYSYFGHLYWQTHHRLTESVFPGFDNEHALGLLIFSPEFQEWYLAYLRALMEPENPYTGLSLGEDPAVAVVEIWNESNLLFWTFNPARMHPVEAGLLEKDFARWLRERYGSLDAARRAWGTARTRPRHTPDHPGEGRMGLYAVGHLTGQDWAQNQRHERRASDQLRWMVESTAAFYETMTGRLREEAGVGAMIAGSNWKTADARVLAGLDRWTYASTDMVLRNAYFSPEFAPEGNPRFFSVDAGDTFRAYSSLKAPASPGPLMTPHIAGHPFMNTENNWTRPSPYRAEWPFLVATYASMMGVDGWNFFALGSSDWQHSMAVWDLNNPTVLGQFPAAALMFRRGDVATPETPAVDETVSLEAAYGFEGTALFCGGGRDVLWVDRIGELEGGSVTGEAAVDSRAFFVGPVRQRFVDGPGQLETVKVSEFIDEENQTVRSMTGELQWNFGGGVVTVNTPRAQGAAGFLGAAGRIELADMVLESENEYGTLLAVSLDGKALSESGRILLQAATRDKPYGFRTEAVEGGFERITHPGGYPLNVEKIQARVILKNSGGRSVTVLDENGYPAERQAETLTDPDGHLHIRFPEETLYLLVK
jgi:hypothetical protein